MGSRFERVSNNLIRTDKLSINERYFMIVVLMLLDKNNTCVLNSTSMKLSKVTFIKIKNKLEEIGIISVEASNRGSIITLNKDNYVSFIGDDTNHVGYTDISRNLVSCRHLSINEILVLCSLQTHEEGYLKHSNIPAARFGINAKTLSRIVKKLAEKKLISIRTTYGHTGSSVKKELYYTLYIHTMRVLIGDAKESSSVAAPVYEHKIKKNISTAESVEEVKPIAIAASPIMMDENGEYFLAPMPAAPKMEKMAHEPDDYIEQDVEYDVDDYIEDDVGEFSDDDIERMNDIMAVAMFGIVSVRKSNVATNTIISDTLAKIRSIAKPKEAYGLVIEKAFVTEEKNDRDNT